MNNLSVEKLTSYYIGHDMIGLPQRDMSHLESLLELADWRVVVQNASFLSTVESYNRMSQGELFDDTIARHFMDSDYFKQVMHELEQGGRLISKFALAIIVTTALRLGKEKEGDGKFPSRDILGELLLTANDIATPDSSDDPDTPDGMSALVRHLGVNSGETPFSRIARYYQLLVDIPQSLPRDSDWRDINALYYQAMGIQIDRLLSLGFGIYSYYNDLGSQLNQRWRSKNTSSTIKPNEWIIDSRTFLKNTDISKEEAQQLMLSLSTNPDNLKGDSKNTDRLFDFTHIKTRPIVHLGDTRFCVPVLDFLFDRVAIGAYFDIINSLSTKKEEDAFGGFFGKVVEKYVHMLLEEMLGESGSKAGRWFKPEDYVRSKGGAEGPDAIIINHIGGSLVAIFIEVKSSRPNRDVITSGDLDKLRNSWNISLIGSIKKPKAAWQLDNAITAFRSGNLSIPGLESSKVSMIYPVIITLDPWPFFINIYSEFLSDINSLNLLSGNDIAPLDIWSCFDLELLSPQVLGGSSLMDIIMQRQDVKAHLPIAIQIGRPSGESNLTSPLLAETWKLMRNRMVSNLGLKE